MSYPFGDICVQQPEGGAPYIDTSNAFANGLVFAALPIDGANVAVITPGAEPQFFTDTASPTFKTAGGWPGSGSGIRGRTYNGSSQISLCTAGSAAKQLGQIQEITMLAIMMPTAIATTTAYGFSLTTAASGTALLGVGNHTTTNQAGFIYRDGTGNGNATGAASGFWANNQASVSVGVRSVSRNIMTNYCNTVQVSTTTASTNNVAPAFDTIGFGGYRRSGSNTFWAGSTFLGLLWNRSLTASEVFDISQNPWQVFKAPAHRLWSNTSAAAFFAAQLKPILQAVNRAGTY